ncbi:MAG TPA: PEP-CTERM sorting domain-containing protein [Thiobacillus sp.]|nr:PEP-CTERM sorting domain-containing protein [Thiobacillus sp.]HQT69482.1 PEP-CTERM sorting domain-containing protein [Thiobacillus sp.]
MSFTLRSILLATILYSTQAAAAEFSFVSGNPADAFGNSYSQTLDGLTTTATAWSTTGKGSRFETAELEIFSGFGMGVCNRDKGLNCSNANTMHALDNKGSTDLVLFSFSSAVTLGNLRLQQFGGDSDLSLWAGSGSLALAGQKPNDLGQALTAVNVSRIDTIKTVDLAAFTGAYDWLAVSARLSNANDFAKLHTLTVQAAVTPVPEANSWTMLLAGLGLVGFAVHRRNGLASRCRA